MPVRRQTPTIAVPRLHSSFGNVRHDYGIEDSIQRADYLSNAVLEDTYEAATRSRGRDHELLRNVNAAIHTPNKSRDNTPTRAGRRTSRLRSLSPVDVKPIARPQPVVPYRNLEKVRSALAAPPAPASLLSSRIDSYLKGSSLPPRPLSRDIASNISYSSLLSRPRSPSETRPYSPQYSVYLSESHVPRSTRSSYSRSPSPYVSRVSAAREYSVGGSDDEDEEDYQIGSYRRKYKILKAPIASGPERAGSADDSEDEFYDASDYYPSYSCPRPTGVSPLKLSTYDGDYDGSYEADMAEMYDYIPYGPSKHAILELTSEDSNDITYKPHVSTLPRLHSPSTSSTYSYSPLPKYTEDSLSRPPASRQLLDSLISNAASRAKAILENSKLPEYKNASLVLSVEGSAVSEDGRNRYGFRYYPPPIPLKGSQIGLDERILSISPKPVSDADSFLSTYLNRLRNIRTDVRDHADKSEYGRCTSVAPRPSYVHQTVTVPVHISGRPHSVPVSSYRSRLSDGQSHRVDVFPLVVSEAALPVDKKLHLPVYRAGGGDSGSPTKLTVLEKINIKVSTEKHISPRAASVSRRVRASTAPPAPRPLPGQQVQQQQYVKVAAPLLATQSPQGPVLVLLVPNSRFRPINHNFITSKPVVLSQGESPWSLRARAASVPPAEFRGLRGASLPPPRAKKSAAPVYKTPEPLPSSKLWAHRPVRPDLLRSARASSLEPTRRASFYESPSQEPLPTATLWAHRPRVLRSDAPRLARARAENLKRAASEPRLNYERPSEYYFGIPEVKERALSRYLYAHRGKFGPESKPPRPTLGNFPQVYVPWRGKGPSNRSKAAIIGSRLETDGAKKTRRPQSEYAANKLREMKRDEIEEGIYYRTPATGLLQASRPPLPKPTERKAIRDVDGFTKPKNLLSWQYRVESRLSPDDLIYEPSSFIRMRERVKDVQDKMDRQRQLLDRYLDSDFKIQSIPSQ
ncbi:hypothetical protein BgiBS90_008158, partial [Biomphalaria glabrata]